MFGFETDTYDLLGMVSDLNSDLYKNSDNFNTDSFRILVEEKINQFVGKNHGLTYPPFSSKTINGKSMFNLALSGKLDQKEIPKSSGEINSIEILSWRAINRAELTENIKTKIALVKGDFRQEVILERWKKALLQEGLETFTWPIVKIKVVCSSGIYMRSLAHDLGKSVEAAGLAYSIKRTKIGHYSTNDVA